MKFYAMRHGPTSLNKQNKINSEINEPLSSEGREKVKASIGLVPPTIKYIYCSSSLRAVETAEIIASRLSLPVYESRELSEVKMGSLAGKAWDEIENGLELKRKHRLLDYDYRSFGGESGRDLIKRLDPFLRDLNSRHTDNEVLVITHGGIIRHFLFSENGTLVEGAVENLSLRNLDLEKILDNFRSVLSP